MTTSAPTSTASHACATHHHEDGLHCSCCSPIWKSLVPKNLTLSVPIKTPEDQPQLEVKIFRVENKEEIKEGKKEGNEGCIITLEGGNNVQVEAIAFKSGKIAATGNFSDILAQFPDGENYTRIITDGQTLLPSFIDPHTHIIPTAIVNLGVNLSPFIGQYLRTNLFHAQKGGGSDTQKVKNYTRDWVINQLQDEANKQYEADQLQDEANKQYEADMQDKAQKVDEEQKRRTILGHNVDPSLLIGAKEFDSSVLDKVKYASPLKNGATAPPIYLTNTSGHIAYINQSAIDIITRHNDAGLDNSTKKISVGTNGILKEFSEMLPPLEFLFSHESEDDDLQTKIAEQVQKIFTTALERGVTYLFDASLDPKKSKTFNQVEVMRSLAGSGCPVRLGGALMVTGLAQLNDKIINHYTPNIGNENFNIAKLKLISDGSAQGLSAYQYDPYDCDENYKNFSNQDVEELNKQNNMGLFNYGYPIEYNGILSVANKHAWPIMIHANGDQAIDRTINAFRAAGINNKTKEQRRDRIEHCSLLTKKSMGDMQELGISPSFTIGHVGYWGWLFSHSAIGLERANQLDLCRSALNDYDMRISFHSDYSVTPLGSLRMMEQSITRFMEDAPQECQDQVLNELETITPIQALRAVTYDAAWQCHADQWVGSLEVGKCADFVLLAQNPLTYCNEKDGFSAKGMRDITVLETWKGGVQRYTLNKDD